MTDPRHGPDQPLAGNADPIAQQPHFTKGDETHPVTRHGRPGQGYQPPPPQFIPSPTGPGKAGLIAAGVVGLVAVLAAGVVIGVIIADGGSEPRPTAVAASSSAPARPSSTAATTPPPAAVPGMYSMNGVANACDLVDPTPLHKWSSTPDQAPYHHERPPSDDDPGRLTCQFTYKSQSGDGVHWNQAAIDLRVEFTAAGAAPAYDEWKHEDTTRSGVSSGEVTGIGSQGYWHTATSDSSHTTGLDYVIGVQDDNVSLRVRIPILRQHGEPLVNPDELAAIARNQAQQALDGLQQK